MSLFPDKVTFTGTGLGLQHLCGEHKPQRILIFPCLSKPRWSWRAGTEATLPHRALSSVPPTASLACPSPASLPAETPSHPHQCPSACHANLQVPSTEHHLQGLTRPPRLKPNTLLRSSAPSLAQHPAWLGPPPSGPTLLYLPTPFGPLPLHLCLGTC